MNRVTKTCKRLLKLLHHGAADESRSPQGLLEHRGQLLLKFDVWRDQIKKRNIRNNAHSVTSSTCSMYRKILAGFPATTLFGGTSFVTTLPALTIAFSPIQVFERIVAPEPIDAPFLTTVRSTLQ